MPCSASSAAVPPVEMISTPSSASARAKSTTPRLSNTVSKARSMRRSPAAGACKALVCVSAIALQGGFVDAHEARVCGVQADRSLGDQADCAGQKLVFRTVEDRQDLLIVPSVGKPYRLLQDDWSGIDSVVYEVDRHTADFDSIGDLVLDGMGPGKGWQQRRMDVDDALGKHVEERR